MTIRALFADFDGPMHPADAVVGYEASGLPLQEYAKQNGLFCHLPILESLLTGHDDLMLIVCSGWRTRCQDYELRAFLGGDASQAGRLFAGSTPYGERYASIMKVVERFDIQEYKILDDAVGEFPAGCEQLIVCDSTLGLSDARVALQLSRWLDETRPAWRHEESPRALCA